MDGISREVIVLLESAEVDSRRQQQANTRAILPGHRESRLLVAFVREKPVCLSGTFAHRVGASLKRTLGGQ